MTSPPDPSPIRPGAEFAGSVLTALQVGRPGWYDAVWVRLEDAAGEVTVAPMSPAGVVADVLEVCARLSLFGAAASGGGPSADDVAETADWIAQMSGHPRYTHGGGPKVLESEADLSVAYTAAVRRHGPGQAEALSHARALLLQHVGQPT